MQVPVEVSGCNGFEHLVVYSEVAVDSRLLLSQFIVVLSSRIVLSVVGITALYISYPPGLPSLGSLWHMGTISRR